MNKSGTLITSALLTFGLAAGSMAADLPKSAVTIGADTPAAGTSDAPKTTTPKKKAKSTSKKKKAAAAPATTK
jgi:hypothetical protein